MNVVYVYPGEWPKGATRVRKQIEVLAASGHSVSLVSRNYSRAPTYEKFGLCHVHRLPVSRFDLLNKLLNFPFFLGPLWLLQISKVVRNSKADCIVVYDLPLAPAAVWVGRWFRIPVHYDMAEVYPVFIKTQWELKQMSWTDHLVRNPAAARRVEKYVLDRVASLSVVSEESKVRCRRLGVSTDRIAIVGNTPDDLLDIRTEAGFPAELNGLEDRLRILFVGILIEDRGLVTAIEAMASVVRVLPSASLVIVGDGTQKAELEQLISDRGLGDSVELVGWREHSTLGCFYQHSHVGVIPFSNTSHIRLTIANKLSDYMAAGLPIVASDVPPMRRILDATGAGVLVPPDDPEALASSLVSLLVDEEKRNQMAEKGRVAAEEKYNWTVDGTIFVRAVERMVARLGDEE